MYAIDQRSRIYVAGHNGMAGSAILRLLKERGFTNLITASSRELDLRDRNRVFEFIEAKRPEITILAAARVGGIMANKLYPADFLSDNLLIQTNVMDACIKVETERLLFLGSSCIYPKFATQPIKESELLNGHLESTNDAYAIAKIAGIQMIESVRRQYQLPWISAMPSNLYGPNDNYDPQSSHVFAALIRRYFEAAESRAESVVNWGTGSVFREFLHVDDLANALLFLLQNYDDDEHINVGTGTDVTLRELADLIATATGFQGQTFWDHSKPDGTPKKLLDVSKLEALGWQSEIDLEQGISRTVQEYSIRQTN
jgi:GDP-L-fucose synthase